MNNALEAVLLLALTVAAVLIRPGRQSPARYAGAAAACALALGLVHARDAGEVVRLTWDATGALVALMIISRLLAEAGLFRQMAWAAARICGGRPRAIFIAAVLLSAAVSAFFTNDGTVLILTPVLAELCAALDLPAAVTLPILVANGFVADAFSTPLVSSNLVNILAVDAYHLTYAGYAAAMALPAVVALAVAGAALWLLYGRRLPPGGPRAAMPVAAAMLTLDRPLFWAGVVALAGAALGLLLTAARPFPLTLVLGPTALALWTYAAARRGVGAAWRAARAAPWEVVAFAAAMNLLIVGVGRAGLDATAATALGPFLRGHWSAVLAVGGLSALLAAVVNNLPSTLFGLLALHPLVPAGVALPTHGRDLVFALVAGDDIGPKLTPMGSLATLIWLRAVRERGFRFGWKDYLTVGAVVTPPTLLAFLVVLAWLH